MKQMNWSVFQWLAGWMLVGCSDPLAAPASPAADSAEAQDFNIIGDVDVAAEAGTIAPAADAAAGDDTTAAKDGQAPLTDSGAGSTGDSMPDTAADAGADVGPEIITDIKAELPPPPIGVPAAKISTPLPAAVFEFGNPVELAGVATDTLAMPGEMVATWTSDKDGLLGTSKPDAAGVVKWTASKLSAGKHLIQLEAKNPQGVAAADTVAIGVCAWASPESFDTKLDGAKWKIYGDAAWDPGGWLEMTGNAQSKFGKIWNIADHVQPGDVQISFKIQTGGGINGGADGFALSVIDTKTVAELEAILSKAGDGGCLGYGVSGDCGPLKISAFHLEIDTFQNKGDNNTDPTSQNHIAVTLDGDATKHWLWAATPTIEDMQWHTVTVEVKLEVVRVTLDSVELFNQAIPGFKFRGGFIGFSGSTGWATNYHRFDELKILQQCLVK